MSSVNVSDNLVNSQPVPTGNYIVQMQPGTKTTTAVKKLAAVSNMNVAVASDFEGQVDSYSDALSEQAVLMLENLNVAVIRPSENMPAASIMTAMSSSSDVKSVRPEFHMFAIDSLEERYNEWVRQGLRILADGPLRAGLTDMPTKIAKVQAEDVATWGVQAVRASSSSFSGRGIKVAILDTGFDLEHPDFVGREIVARSFVAGETVQDGNGHGTHCVGTAAGPLSPSGVPRYGVAYEAEIFVGKVLNNIGSGREGEILSGMNWAIGEGCHVISMSLGRPTSPGEPFDPIYEDIGQTALENGCLIIAAAGNESARQFNHIAPVGAPANSPSIMAVGAVDEEFRVARFSCGGINSDGGEVNIAAPGVDILSSSPMPRRHVRLQGTSMACPHVAGVATLLAQSDSNLRGRELWDALRRSAVDIRLPIRDGGAGLVQSPGSGGSLIA